MGGGGGGGGEPDLMEQIRRRAEGKKEWKEQEFTHKATDSRSTLLDAIRYKQKSGMRHVDREAEARKREEAKREEKKKDNSIFAVLQERINAINEDIHGDSESESDESDWELSDDDF